MISDISPIISNELIIKLDNEFIWLNEKRKIEYSNSNLPKEHFTLKTRNEIFWKVTYELRDKTLLNIKVIDFNVKNINSFHFQDDMQDVSNLEFEKLEWLFLEPFLTIYNYGKLSTILTNKEKHPLDIYLGEKNRNTYNKEPNLFSSQQKRTVETEPFGITKKEFIHAQFEAEFTEATFLDGKVAVTIQVQNRYFEVEIFNPFIKQNFDLIKGWFPKKFQKKTFSFSVKASLINNQLQNVETNSEDILLIDQTCIDSLQIHSLNISIEKANNTNKVYSIEQLITNDGNLSNIFKTNDQDKLPLLKEFINNQNVRNAKELNFLASHTSINTNKLSISVFDKIGFLFMFNNKQITSFVWELLDSNATYLWVFNNTNYAQVAIFQIVEIEISKICKIGRENYIKALKKANQNGFDFYRVIHNSYDRVEKGFSKWTERINDYIGATHII